MFKLKCALIEFVIPNLSLICFISEFFKTSVWYRFFKITIWICAWPCFEILKGYFVVENLCYMSSSFGKIFWNRTSLWTTHLIFYLNCYFCYWNIWLILFELNFGFLFYRTYKNDQDRGGKIICKKKIFDFYVLSV